MRHAGMGYHNYNAAIENVVQHGKLLHKSRGKLSIDMTAYAMLITMCNETYDYPISEKVRRNKMPVRLYDRGLKYLAGTMGMVVMSFDQLQRDDASVAHRARKRTAINRLSTAMNFLCDQGVVKVLQKGCLGKTAKYLLMIGDDDENAKVEHYDRRVLGLD